MSTQLVRLLLSIFCILNLLSIIPHYASCEEFVRGIVEISGHLADGTSIKVKVQKIKLPYDYPYKNAFMWGGDETKMPKTIITGVDVKVGNKKSFIPLSAYSDLGNPGQVSLGLTQNGFQLTIIGGDAAGSYKSVLFFENGYICRRKVEHGEFPEQVWQETVYSFNIKTEDKK